MSLRLLPACFVFLMTILLLSVPAAAADWSVPRDFATIQAAINSPSVAEGDRILVNKFLYHILY